MSSLRVDRLKSCDNESRHDTVASLKQLEECCSDAIDVYVNRALADENGPALGAICKISYVSNTLQCLIKDLTDY